MRIVLEDEEVRQAIGDYLAKKSMRVLDSTITYEITDGYEVLTGNVLEISAEIEDIK